LALYIFKTRAGEALLEDKIKNAARPSAAIKPVDPASA